MSSKKSQSSEQRRRSSRTISGPSLTQQHMAPETDINNIVKRYLPTGSLPSHGKQPIYGDFSSVDYMSMQNQIADIDSTFMRLPSRLRSRFKNDAYQLLRFVEDPKNQPEAVRLGLLVDPNKPYGFDPETGLIKDDQVESDSVQLDAMDQAQILAALDPESEMHDPAIAAELRESAKVGDEEARALLEVAAQLALKRASKPPKKPQARGKGGK